MMNNENAKSAVLSELTVLFLIFEQEKVSAYKVEQIISETGIREWISISTVTIYNTCKRLLKAGYVTASIESTENFDEVTLYTITETGRQFVVDTISNEMRTFNRDRFSIDVPLGFNAYVPTEKKIKFLKERTVKIKERIKELEEKYENFFHSPFAQWMLIDHEISYLKNELSWVRKIIRSIKKDQALE